MHSFDPKPRPRCAGRVSGAGLAALLLLGACHPKDETAPTPPATAEQPGQVAPTAPDTLPPGATPSQPRPEGPGEPDEPASDPTLQTFRYTASTETFLNPERGFYGHVDLLGTSTFDGLRTRGHSLAYAALNLGEYRNGALPDSVLGALQAGFERVRRAGIKVIPRIVYAESAGEDDVPLGRAQEHLAQLAPVLGRNADVIAVLQAGIIGAWGEWHASTSGLDTPGARAAVLDALLAALPASRMVQVRTPEFKEEAFGGPLTEAQAFSGSAAARVGHHNDCFLANATDMGTYPSDEVEQWKAFVAQEGRFTPVGGETCAVSSPRSDCPSATAELERLHWSYLNASYNTDVLERWSSQGCMPDVQRRLGYRFELLSAGFSRTVRAGQALALEVQLRNVGYAAPYNARPVYLVLEGPGGRHALRLEGADPRRWEPGATHALRHQVQLPEGLAAGTYRASLWLPDAASTLQDRPEYAVRMANTGTWVADSGLNLLTPSIQVQ